MSEPARDFTRAFGHPAAAGAYEEILVPRLFGPCAVYLLTRLGLEPGHTLVDVACGTGIVARLAAPIVGPAGRVYGRDLNEAMLDIGRAHPPAPDAAPLDLEPAPAAELDLDDGVADRVTCQQGLQFFPDPDAALREMHRVARPGGRVGIAVWKSIEECPLWAALEVGLGELIGPERVTGIRQPFSWAGEDALVGGLSRAALRDVAVSSHTVVMHFGGGTREALGVLGASPFAADLVSLDRDQREGLARTVTRALGVSDSPDQPVDVPARTLVATAWR